MLGVTVPDIHRALDRAAQAAMNGARPNPLWPSVRIPVRRDLISYAIG